MVGDPLANITLGGSGTAAVLGDIVAPGGTIAVTPQYAWIGEDAVLDVSGTFVRDPRVTAYSTGTVLPGGTITLSGAAVVALAGSVFDISGGHNLNLSDSSAVVLFFDEKANVKMLTLYFYLIDYQVFKKG